MVLSCLDSRQPGEIVFDQGIGDIFSARVAGECAERRHPRQHGIRLQGFRLGNRLQVVGHSNCGAIKGAIDDVELGNLTSLLAKIKPAMEALPYAIAASRNSKKSFVRASGVRGECAAGG